MSSLFPHQQSLAEKSSAASSGTGNFMAGEPARRAGFAMDDRDWDALFAAVAQRLTESVSDLSACLSTEPDAGSYLPRTAFTLQTVRGQVLDCVEGLARLHAALRFKRELQELASSPEAGPTDPRS